MRINTASFSIPKGVSPKSIGFGSTRAERDTAFNTGGLGIPDERYVQITSEQYLSANSYFVTRKTALVWDTTTDSPQFVFRIENYARRFKEDRAAVISEEFTIPGNTMWDNGVFVDQTRQRLILPDGRWIHGPSGELFSVHGEPFTKKNLASKEC